MFAGCSQGGMKKPYDDVEYWDESSRADPNPHLNAGVSQHKVSISEGKMLLIHFVESKWHVKKTKYYSHIIFINFTTTSASQ